MDIDIYFIKMSIVKNIYRRISYPKPTCGGFTESYILIDYYTKYGFNESDAMIRCSVSLSGELAKKLDRNRKK